MSGSFGDRANPVLLTAVTMIALCLSHVCILPSPRACSFVILAKAAHPYHLLSSRTDTSFSSTFASYGFEGPVIPLSPAFRSLLRLPAASWQHRRSSYRTQEMYTIAHCPCGICSGIT